MRSMISNFPNQCKDLFRVKLTLIIINYNIATFYARSDWLIFYEKEMDGSQRWFRLTSLSVKFHAEKRLFSVKNVSLCYKSNGQCLACVHPIRDALGQLGEHLGSQRCSRLRLEHLLRYLRALPTIRVHPELDGRTLDIVHSLINQACQDDWMLAKFLF